MVIVVLTLVSEMTGVVAVQIGASRRYDGPMGKSDRAFVFEFIYSQRDLVGQTIDLLEDLLDLVAGQTRGFPRHDDRRSCLMEVVDFDGPLNALKVLREHGQFLRWDWHGALR